MKRLLFRNPEGKYLNTDYHSSLRHGEWREKEDARLYRTTTGLMQAFRTATPGIKKHLGLEPVDSGHRWTDEDREQSRAFWDAFRKLSSAERLELYKLEGYEVIEVEI